MNTNYTSPCTHDIMSRVRTVYAVRAWLSSPAAGVVAVLTLMFVADCMVSSRQVITNILMHSNLGEEVSYVFVSLLHTRTTVQIVAVTFVLVAGVTLINSARSIKRLITRPALQARA